MGIPAAVKFPVQSANGNTTAILYSGGRGVFVAFGTFGSGTCTLQWSPDDGTTWLNVDATGNTFCTLTGPGSGGFELPPCQLRCALTGATGPSITAGVVSSNKVPGY